MVKRKSFKEYLKISKENINDHMKELPSLFYEYGLKETKVKDAIEDLELKLEIKSSTVAAQYRIKHKNMSNPPSETHVKDIVKANTELQKMREELNVLNKTHRLIKLKLRTLTEKREMMINIAHNIREEKKSAYNKTKI